MSVSSPLLGGYDQPEIFSNQFNYIAPFALTAGRTYLWLGEWE